MVITALAENIAREGGRSGDAAWESRDKGSFAKGDTGQRTVVVCGCDASKRIP